MKKIKLIIKTIFSFYFLLSCSSLGDAKKIIGGEKISNKDEFLIEKNQPLSLPPNYSEVLSPDSMKKDTKKDTVLNQIISSAKDSKNSKSKTTSTEESLLKQIKKD